MGTRHALAAGAILFTTLDANRQSLRLDRESA
jgi:hypothetical protein